MDSPAMQLAGFVPSEKAKSFFIGDPVKDAFTTIAFESRSLKGSTIALETTRAFLQIMLGASAVLVDGMEMEGVKLGELNTCWMIRHSKGVAMLGIPVTNELTGSLEAPSHKGYARMQEFDPKAGEAPLVISDGKAVHFVRKSHPEAQLEMKSLPLAVEDRPTPEVMKTRLCSILRAIVQNLVDFSYNKAVE